MEEYALVHLLTENYDVAIDMDGYGIDPNGHGVTQPHPALPTEWRAWCYSHSGQGGFDLPAENEKDAHRRARRYDFEYVVQYRQPDPQGHWGPWRNASERSKVVVVPVDGPAADKELRG